MISLMKRRWRNRRDARVQRELMQRLDDHLLKDIGLFRDQAGLSHLRRTQS